MVGDFLVALQLPGTAPVLSAAQVDRLIVLSDLATQCRSAVVRGGGHHDEITLVPPPEELPRLMGALVRLSAGLTIMGVSDAQRWHLLVKCALDGIHSLRRRLLDVLVDAQADLASSSVAGRCTLPQSTARRHLEDLTALGVLDRTGRSNRT